MKKMMTLATCLLTLFACANTNDDKVIRVDELPQNAQTFIDQHFPKQQIALVKVDKDLLDKKYEVIFTNRNELEFNKNGEWKEVDCKYSEVPAAIIPQQIKESINMKYPQAKVLEIDRDARGYDVKLDNRLELEYNNNFELVDID